MPEQTIYREAAIQAYRRGLDKDVIPRLISWPIITCSWLLLAILLVATLTAWYVQVPEFVEGQGIILAGGGLTRSADAAPVAVVFLPPDRAAQLQVGQPVDLQIGAGETHLRGTIANVDAAMLSPEAARRAYHLDAAGAPLITRPSVVAVIDLPTTWSAAPYAGRPVPARAEVGSRRLLALVPGLERLVR